MSFGMFGEDFERRQDGFRKVAAMAPKGLGLEQVVPGAVVTFSSCRATGDRSYTDTVFVVLATSPGNIVAKMLYGGHRHGKDDDGVRIISTYEREVYAAEHLMDAINVDRQDNATTSISGGAP